MCVCSSACACACARLNQNGWEKGPLTVNRIFGWGLDVEGTRKGVILSQCVLSLSLELHLSSFSWKSFSTETFFLLLCVWVCVSVRACVWVCVSLWVKLFRSCWTVGLYHRDFNIVSLSNGIGIGSFCWQTRDPNCTSAEQTSPKRPFINVWTDSPDWHWLLYALVNGTIDNALLSNGKLNLIRRNVKQMFLRHP